MDSFRLARRDARSPWAWRGFIVATALRELRARHARSLMGWAWLLLPPLALIAIYAIVFSRLMRAGGLPDHGPYTYSVYLCAGMLPWLWFSELVQRASTLFVQHAQVIKKTAVPWGALLAVEVLVACFGLAVQLLLFALLLGLAGIAPQGPALLAWLPALAVQGLFALALGVPLAVFNVFFRDVAMAVPIALQIWFWLTPLVYPLAALPEALQPWVLLNPATVFAQSAQAAFVPGLPGASATALGVIAVLSLVLLWAGTRMAQRNLPQVRDEL
ncbi:MAG: ABC transporter permease [Betaproteobacteria bacterium]|nr:ABC transporter permease [Betaproteobacteria bacterium]